MQALKHNIAYDQFGREEFHLCDAWGVCVGGGWGVQIMRTQKCTSAPYDTSLLFKSTAVRDNVICNARRKARHTGQFVNGIGHPVAQYVSVGIVM